MEPKITSYAGMLDQSDFKQWYTHVDFRIAYQYTTEEVSFLMSKPPYYFSDYEIISSAFRLTSGDVAALSDIFRGSTPKQLQLDEDNVGHFEKRIIRVKRVEETKQIGYTITIPWTIKGRLKCLTFCEQKRRENLGEKAEILLRCEHAVSKLFALGFFRHGRLAFDIYREVEERCQWSPQLRPAYVKEVLYEQINAGRLTLKMHLGQLHFQERGVGFLVHQGEGSLSNRA